MGKQWKQWETLFFWAPKLLQMVTAAMKLSKMLASWKKSYDQPRQHIKKKRYFFANEGPSSQSYGFSSGHVWIWELDCKETWTLMNWCFRTVVLEKTLDSPLDCKEIQSILKEISPKYSLEGLMLKLKLQYFGHLLWRVDSLETTLMLGGIGGRRRRGDREWDGCMASLTQWTWVWVNSGSWWWTGRPGMLQFMGSQRVGHDWVTELNWIWSELNRDHVESIDCIGYHSHFHNTDSSYPGIWNISPSVYVIFDFFH